jgi:hypothetical protein
MPQLRKTISGERMNNEIAHLAAIYIMGTLAALERDGKYPYLTIEQLEQLILDAKQQLEYEEK